MKVHLAPVQPIHRVGLNVAAAYGSAYQIRVSNNAGGPWAPAYDNPAGDGGIDDLKVTATARYVRLYGTTRATPYGYSPWEFEVYGACPGGTPSASPTATATATPTATPTTAPPTGRTRQPDAHGADQAG